MDRKKNIKKKISKAGLEKGHLAAADIDHLIDEYISGVNKNLKGDTTATAVSRFLDWLPPETRQSFNDMVDELMVLDQKKVKRFRQKAVINLMIAYQNGSAWGANEKKAFDLKQFIKDIQKELGESPNYKISSSQPSS